ncbi:MAG: hypothetical protein H6R01_574 [Burkholderiaceae bacterium]|nr:hypothetical protein [Burkholderiaceae bacterium]
MKKNQESDLETVLDVTLSTPPPFFARLKFQSAAITNELFPLEVIALSSFCISLLLIAIFDVRFYYPSNNSSVFVLKHYIIGLILALSIVLFFSWNITESISLKLITKKSIYIARYALSFSSIIFFHFNFKLWAQLVNPVLFDDWYKYTDEFLAPLHHAIVHINIGFTPLETYLTNAYHDVFVFMFYISFAFFGIFTKARPYLERLTCAIALVLIIGGLCYMIAPAWGPFIYSEHKNFIQKAMLDFQIAFIQTHGAKFSGDNFISPLGAMPSLHTAHAFVLWFYARRHIKLLGYIYIPLVIYIITEAVSSGWHYIVDIFLGLIVASVSVLLAEKFHLKK